jgi:DNA mismatch endonuclease (patch repair protein)
MTDRLSPQRRSYLMQQVKQRDTGPEKLVRSLLHRLGYRFRLHRKDLPGTPDIVLPARHVAIFVHGCFWHGHGCSIGKAPKSRLEYWGPKIEGNQERDRRKSAELAAQGWRVEEVWQCELRDMDALENRLKEILE